MAGLLALWFSVTQPFAGATETTKEVSLDPRRLEAHVRTLSEQLGPRDAGHPRNLDRAAGYIEKELAATGARVERQSFDVDGRQYHNVIARFGPPAGKLIVVGAHYDSFEALPGADDNASGVAGLIELGRLLRNQPLERPVQLVAYTLEEPPFFRTSQMGSAVHAESLERSGGKVRAMFSLEMIGYFSDEEGSQSYPLPLMWLFYPTRGNFIAVVGRLGEGRLVRQVKSAMAGASTLPVRSISAPTALAGVDFSDHLNYWQRDYPAVMITDTAFFRNRAYHTERDTADRLDYRRMGQVVSGVLAAVLELAKGNDD